MNPLLLAIPDQIKTERLIIRAPRNGDGAALNRAVCESLPELRPWMPWAQKEPSLEDSELNLREAQRAWIARTELRLLLFNREGILVGSSGLHDIDWEVPRFEIGYWLRTSFCGQGLMTEAVRAIADFAFQTLDARRVEIHCDRRNTRSSAVALRAGFSHEATLRNFQRNPDDSLGDQMIYACLR
jgi:RimJ/RimL family protein N-acetyltransferase